jgi:hypothetical protein
MTTIVAGGVTVAEHATVSPFVLSTLSISGTLSRQNTVQLADGGVAFVGRDVGEAGSISFECHILGASTDDCVDLVDDIMAAFGPASDNRELTLTMGTRSKVYRGRPLSCVPVLDGSQYGAARCSFTVADPRWFGSLTKSVTIGVASLSGGMTTPLTTPLITTGSGSSGDAVVTNAGTAPAPWTAYVSGPVTNPRLILGGNTIELLGVVPAGSTLVVDSYEGTIRLDGASRPWATFESVWWEIPAGTWTFSFRATAGTGSATLIWHDAST